MDRFLQTPNRLGRDIRNPALANALGLSSPTSPVQRARSPRASMSFRTPTHSPTRDEVHTPNSPRTPHGRQPHLLSESSPALFADPQSSPLRPPTSPLVRKMRGHSLQTLPVAGIRDDFYASLVCYQPRCDMYAIAQGEYVSVWNDQLGGEPVGLPRTFGQVVAVAISATGMLAVLYEHEILCIYNATMQLYMARELLPEAGTSVSWPAEGDDHLYVGNGRGQITLYTLHHSRGRFSFIPRQMGRKHRDIVCRIVVNSTGDYLISACGSGMLNVWKIQSDHSLKHKYGMPHKGQLRAIAFCPWSPYLVASGGGRIDRQVRVWDVRVFREFKYKFYVPGQVTSIVWLAKWDVFVAFGHDQQAQSRMLGAAYCLPRNQLVQTFVGARACALDAVPWGSHGACIVGSKGSMLFFRWTPEEVPPAIVGEAPKLGVILPQELR